MEPNDATKQKMMDILRRFHTQEEEMDSTDELVDSTSEDGIVIYCPFFVDSEIFVIYCYEFFSLIIVNILRRIYCDT